MGNFFTAYISQTVNTGLAINTGVFALIAGAGRNINIWRLDFQIANSGAAGAASSRLGISMRRCAAGTFTGGGAGVVAPVVPGQVAVATSIFATAGLGASATGDKLYLAGHPGILVGQSIFVFDRIRQHQASDIPMAVVRATQQFALVLDVASPAAGTYDLTGSITFEES